MIITMDEERNVYMDGYVAIDAGRIRAVGPSKTCNFSADEEIGGDGYLVLPGLVNVHSHLVQGCIRGMAEGHHF